MTAFARHELEGEWGSLIIEIRTVNSRFLEINPRIADDLRQYENKVRNAINARLSRGKVDCTIRYKSPEIGETAIKINTALAKELAHATRELDSIIYNPSPVSSFELLKWPGVIEPPSADPEALSAALELAMSKALDDLDEGRLREGEKLKVIIEQRIDAIGDVVTHVAKRLPEVLQKSRERLHNRLAELTQEINQDRLEQEMVILAQKLDVDEELDRLKTHMSEVKHILKQKKPIGRRLDFLMQELNREANTLGSKSIDIETTQASIDLKVFIEQMREQIQNIE
jgi:uncharacterized protein (TIGR00255 family)